MPANIDSKKFLPRKRHHNAVPARLRPVLIFLKIPAHCKLCMMVYARPVQGRIHVRLYPVIAVHIADIGALRQCKPCISRIWETSVWLVQDFDAAVSGCIRVALCGRCIGRAVINQNDFQILIGLLQDRIHASVQIRLDIVDRDDDRDQILHQILIFHYTISIF